MPWAEWLAKYGPWKQVHDYWMHEEYPLVLVFRGVEGLDTYEAPDGFEETRNTGYTVEWCGHVDGRPVRVAWTEGDFSYSTSDSVEGARQEILQHVAFKRWYHGTEENKS